MQNPELGSLREKETVKGFLGNPLKFMKRHILPRLLILLVIQPADHVDAATCHAGECNDECNPPAGELQLHCFVYC